MKHESMIKGLVVKLGEVLDPFNSGPARNIKSRVLLDDLIVKGLLKSDETDEKHSQDFILKRFKINENDDVSFFCANNKPEIKNRIGSKSTEN